MKKDKQLLKMVTLLIKASFSEGKIIERQVTKSIKILKSLPRSKSIPAMLEFLKGLKRQEREHTLYIETTTPLSSDQINKAKKIVERKTKITKVIVSINSEILGGFKLRVGDQIWDESILEKINQVKEVIIS